MVVDKVIDRECITDMVCQHVDGAKLRRTHGKELAYTLPLEEVKNFKSMSYLFSVLPIIFKYHSAY